APGTGGRRWRRRAMHRTRLISGSKWTSSSRDRVGSTMKAMLQSAFSAVVVLALLVLIVFSMRGYPVAAGSASMVPLPVVDAPSGNATSSVAVLAGGCFWGVQGVYQHVKGVTNAVSGYAGGEKRTADYETVSTGRTGHAESVLVTYDPHQI